MALRLKVFLFQPSFKFYDVTAWLANNYTSNGLHQTMSLLFLKDKNEKEIKDIEAVVFRCSLKYVF